MKSQTITAVAVLLLGIAGLFGGVSDCEQGDSIRDLQVRVSALEELQEAPQAPQLLVVSAPPLKPSLKVVRYVDGDTFYIEHIPDKPVFEKIRMLRINTPERGKPYYSEASLALKTLLERGTVISLEFEGETGERGNYGRLLAYVIVDGKNINLEMVRLGWSKFYVKYGEGKYADRFRAAEKEAKENRRGLWQ